MMTLGKEVDAVWNNEKNLKEEINKLEENYPIFSYLPQLFMYTKSKVDPYVNILESLRKEFLTFRSKPGNNKKDLLDIVNKSEVEYLNNLTKENNIAFKVDMLTVFRTYLNALTQDLLFNGLPVTEENKKYINTKKFSNTKIKLLKKVNELLNSSLYNHSFTFLEYVGKSQKDPSRELYSVKAIESINVTFRQIYQKIWELKSKDTSDYA